MAVTLNASTSTGYIQSADTSGILELQSNGTTQFTVASTGAYGQIKSGTSVTASGTSVDFTSIPSWVRRITVMFNGVSTNGTSNLLIQLGTSGGVVSSGYVSGAWTSNTSNAASTAGVIITGANTAAATHYGTALVCNISGNSWVTNYAGGWGSGSADVGGGSIALSGTLDRVRITTVNGTDTFDAGTINILYEG